MSTTSLTFERGGAGEVRIGDPRAQRKAVLTGQFRTACGAYSRASMADFQVQSNSGRYWATGNVKQVQGQRGLGFYRLIFLTVLNVESGDSAVGERLSTMSTDVAAAGRTLGRANAQPHQLPIAPANYAQERQVNFELDLDRARLEAIESVRNGGDITFNITFFPTLADQSGQLRQTTAQAAFVANQSTWAGVLEQMDYQKVMLLELPVPDGVQFPELAAAARSLAQAQQAMARGDYREAVGLCRDVLEEVMLALKDDDIIDFTGTREMDKAKRLRLLRRAARVFTHPARHKDEVAVALEWNRVDAASTISLVAALLNELAAPAAR